ncbi:MAG: hypothetical protein M1834_009585 [Cirrosporium novae-zelandiae]|nr:MAG: hypothetical protein M1834_009585 [Cirrosporium novae-zelandiae]
MRWMLTSTPNQHAKELPANWKPLLYLLPVLLLLYRWLLNHVVSGPLSRIPGPRAFALTRWRLAYEDFIGRRTQTINSLHDHYGPVVRVGPTELSFNSLSALRTIYGAGSGFERTSFYRMFDVYGRQNLFTFAEPQRHAERKKLLSNAYAKSTVASPPVSSMVEGKVAQYLELLLREENTASQIFQSLHYFSIDSITEFLYGPKHGGTSALTGSEVDRALLNDILDPARRKLSWFAVHLPGYTKWILSQVGLMERFISFLGLLPMDKPTTYTGIRAHALNAWKSFKAAPPVTQKGISRTTVIGRLRSIQADHGLEDLEIASELADHLLAGIDTTADSLMFLIWVLSLPQNSALQQKLRNECVNLPVNASGVPTCKTADQLPYLNAVIKETLRLYPPLPATEPRTSPVDIIIDGYRIPAGTVVGMSPYTLHREPSIFPEPLLFDPERWLGGERDMGAESRRWWWAFSSGGRMCIGSHLAMAEMTTLVAALYHQYRTRVRKGFEDVSPGVTSRFEVFYDETMTKVMEHECWIDFEKVNVK